ncbi:MAG: hypothetical protein ACO1TE_12585 [Prosthecobacter sp.]
MNPSSLHALVIDRHFGELSPEATELLELHLANDADAQAEAQRILRALAVTQKTVMQHPELARMPLVEKALEPMPSQKSGRSLLLPWLARAAAVLLLAALTGAGGFLAGRSSTPSAATAAPEAEIPAPATATPPRKESPWARYRMTFDPAGQGMQVVRVDTLNLQEKSMP